MQTIVFNVFEGTSAICMAKAEIVGNEAQNVQLISRVPRMDYYSILNQAMGMAQEIVDNSEIEKYTKKS